MHPDCTLRLPAGPILLVLHVLALHPEAPGRADFVGFTCTHLASRGPRQGRFCWFYRCPSCFSHSLSRQQAMQSKARQGKAKQSKQQQQQEQEQQQKQQQQAAAAPASSSSKQQQAGSRQQQENPARIPQESSKNQPSTQTRLQL